MGLTEIIPILMAAGGAVGTAIMALAGAVVYLFKRIDERHKQCESELSKMRERVEELEVMTCIKTSCTVRDNPFFVHRG